MHEPLEVRHCQKPRHALTIQGELMAVPSDWALLPPRDAALSQRIKADSPSWTIKEKKGREGRPINIENCPPQKRFGNCLH